MRGMKNTEFPLKKNFEQDFISENWQALFTLKYTQATMEEYHEFFQQSDNERQEELYEFIKKQLPLTLSEKILTFIFWKRFRGKVERSLDIEKMCMNIIENRFRTYESVYTKTEHLRTTKTANRKVLFSANLSMVCQKYCISPTELFKNFTLEQYIWLQDWIIFNSNEADAEWQTENKMALVDKDEVKARAEETRKAFEEMEKSK